MVDRASPSAQFRAELLKIMPGYVWTVHKSRSPDQLTATGTQSSGFNRLSTLQVTRTEHAVGVWYEAKSSGYGLRSPWLMSNTDASLARALRGLQNGYEEQANTYRNHALHLQMGRKPPETDNHG